MPDHPPAIWAWICAISALAFVVRGLSGFGSSMVGIGGLSMLLPPAQVVPAFLALEVIATLPLLRGLRGAVDWRLLRWVLAGCALATPLGLVLLSRLPVRPMQGLIGAVLLGVALLMLSGAASRFGPDRPPGRGGALLAGGLSGLLNGAVGISGPPVIVFFFSRLPVAAGRATLIAFFLVSDLYAIALAARAGLLDREAGALMLGALPAALAGIWAGQHLYTRLDEARLRRTVWALLAAIGALGLARALWA